MRPIRILTWLFLISIFSQSYSFASRIYVLVRALQ